MDWLKDFVSTLDPTRVHVIPNRLGKQFVKKPFFISLLLLTNFTAFAQPENLGSYVGVVKAVWLDDGRRMELLEDFTYIDPKNVEWRAHQGAIIDGASIPRVAWSVIGGPFEGKYRNASVIHDVACNERDRRWEEVHEMFYYAMLRSGVESWRAKVMYYAVYNGGPRWSHQIDIKVPPMLIGTSGEKEFASSRALKDAAPGSSVGAINGTLGRWEIEVLPPPSRLEASDFEQLKGKIITTESGYGLSLEDIRAYEPVR